MPLVLIPIVLIWSYVSNRWQAHKARQLVQVYAVDAEPIVISP